MLWGVTGQKHRRASQSHVVVEDREIEDQFGGVLIWIGAAPVLQTNRTHIKHQLVREL